jgi:hypothetical protein
MYAPFPLPPALKKL